MAVQQLAVRIATWIPEDWVLFNDTPSTTTWFKGDGANRGFSADAASYRTAQQVNFDFNVGSITYDYYENCGQTVKKVLEKNLVPPRTTYQYGTASTSGLDVAYVDSHLKSSPGDVAWYKLKLTGAVADPLQFLAPDLNYEFTITAYDTGMVQVQGQHDGYPNFEIFKKKDFMAWEPVYTFDAPANGKTILALFPPMDVTGINRAI